MNNLRNTIIGLALPCALLAAAPAMARIEPGIGMAVAMQVTPPGYPYPPPGYVSPPPRYLDPPPPAYVYPPGTPVYPQPGYVYPAPGYVYPPPGYAYPPRPHHPHHPPPPDWRQRDSDRDGVPDRWDRQPYDPWRR